MGGQPTKSIRLGFSLSVTWVHAKPEIYHLGAVVPYCGLKPDIYHMGASVPCSETSQSLGRTRNLIFITWVRQYRAGNLSVTWAHTKPDIYHLVPLVPRWKPTYHLALPVPRRDLDLITWYHQYRAVG